MAKMTIAQYYLLPEDRNQYELFDGDLVVTASPNVQAVESPLFQSLALPVASIF